MITQQQAQEMLEQVEQTQQRSQRFLGYWRNGVYAQLWGIVWIVAHLGCFVLPRQMGLIWLSCDVAGVVGTVMLRRREPESAPAERRWVWAMLIILGFGLLVSILIGSRPRALEVFWTCLVMTAYMLQGLWMGLRWTVLGAAVCIMSVLSYFFLAPWYDLVMAVVGGGGLLLGGTWMRRAR